MRRLAAELDTGAASIYVYFKDVDALYAAVLDEQLGSLNLARGRKPWRERLVTLLTSYTDLLTSFPALAKTALFTRPSGPRSVRLWEAMLALLSEGGIRGRDAAWAGDFLLQRATATAAEDGSRRLETNTAAADVEVEEVIRSVSPKDRPHLAAVAAEMLSGTPTSRLAWSFEVILDGLAHDPTRAAKSAKSRTAKKPRRL